MIYTKETGGKHYIIQDAAMNDLIRPTLYDSFHRIWPVAALRAAGTPDIDMAIDPDKGDPFRAMPETFKQDVVGPVCESGDFLAKDRPLPSLQARRPAGRLLRRGLRHGDGHPTTTAASAPPRSSLQAARTA